jgi:hypothetical protein
MPGIQATRMRSFRAGEPVKIALLMHGLAGLIALKVNRQIYGLAAQRTEEPNTVCHSPSFQGPSMFYTHLIRAGHCDFWCNPLQHRVT